MNRITNYSRAIIPYGFRYKMDPRLRTAFRAGSYAWSKRKQIRQGFRTGKRLYKRYKAAQQRAKSYRENISPMNIGKPIGTSDTKQCEVNNIFSAGDTRVLYTAALIDLVQGDREHERERGIVNLSGIKIYGEFINNQSGAVDPKKNLSLNVAIVSPKDQCVSVDSFDSEFFRSEGGIGNPRARDFDTTLSSADFNNLPINTDKYVVLKRMRWTLAMTSSAQTTTDSSYVYMNHYQKVNRQISFSDQGETIGVNNPIYLVWWCDGLVLPSLTASTANAFSFNIRTTCFFRDPK